MFIPNLYDFFFCGIQNVSLCVCVCLFVGMTIESKWGPVLFCMKFIAYTCIQFALSFFKAIVLGFCTLP